MRHCTTILGLLALLLLPLNASAFWWGAAGQCAADEAEAAIPESSAVESVWLAIEQQEDCSTADPTDPSSNACFEAAGHPISTLPELIAQSQAEELVAGMVDDALEHVAAVQPLLLPSPDEASVEDPEMPGVPLLAKPVLPSPKRAPNSCSIYPEECESAPWVPTVSFEVSVPSALDGSELFDVPGIGDVNSRRGPPDLGVGPASGFERDLERPPEIA